MSNGQALVAVVEKARARVAVGALRAEGVYDDDRSVYDCGPETVAVPVTRPPTETDVVEVASDVGESEVRTLSDHLCERGWSEAERERAPGSWAVVGSVVLVRVADCPRPRELGEALLAIHGGADTVLANDGVDGPHREPEVEVVAGEGDTETVHREHGTVYALDLSEVVFSPGNETERVRMGGVVDSERVLDMFAGVGQFTLPMARAGARVTAVERNPAAFEYLVENVVRNEVQPRVETYRADCRAVIAAGGSEFAFDRVVMGHDDAHEYLDAAFEALAPGGTVHVHAATPEALVPDRPVGRIREAAGERTVEVLDVRQIRDYGEGVTHLVVDLAVE
jgi:tRNA wybutosine-synthesizing protein 2